MEFTDEQKSAVRGVLKRIDSDQYVRVGGYAGVGKTTVIRIIEEALRRKNRSFAICAYTGKATNVLRRKRMHADTIHGTIYKPQKDHKGNVYWTLMSRWDLADKRVDGFIVDEASMVSREIHDDLVSFGLPIIYVGDHGQLEAIGTKFNLMENPDFRLEKIHRNAGEIAYFAEHLRKGGEAWNFPCKQKVQLVQESAIQPKHLSSVDQVICAFNRTRVELNAQVREFRRIKYTYVAVGEKIVCLRNNKHQGLFNGLQGIVTKILPNDCFDFISDGKEFNNIQYHLEQFGQETNNFEFSDTANPFDYGYAQTAHKCQGDQFGSVIAYEQHCDKWDHARWAYTVASRAMESLIWVTKRKFMPRYLV